MTRVVSRVRQVGGGVRVIRAQDAAHAERARQILRDDPAMIDRLHGVDGIRITVAEVRS